MHELEKLARSGATLARASCGKRLIGRILGKSNASARSFHCLLRLMERVLGSAPKDFHPLGEKGAVFERLTQLYLQTAPEYQSELEHIWTLREVPPHVRKLLALPALDEGIDFIARTRHGKYWAIQSKFRSQHDKPLTRKELGTFQQPSFQYLQRILRWRLSHTRHQNPSANVT